VGKFVALFRGINVGKAKRIAMADLRALLGSLGYTEVSTLLNSGNAVFEGKTVSAARHAERIESAVSESLGVRTLVIVKTAKELDAIVAGNALVASCSDPSRLLVAFVANARSLSALAGLANKNWGDEALHIGQHAAYLWCANGILESKAGVALLRDLEGAGTTRNWGTTLKLQALLQRAGQGTQVRPA
jgi:uncharacterized protein (DUF1697 family)